MKSAPTSFQVLGGLSYTHTRYFSWSNFSKWQIPLQTLDSSFEKKCKNPKIKKVSKSSTVEYYWVFLNLRFRKKIILHICRKKFVKWEGAH
jgi:hypothetical protein